MSSEICFVDAGGIGEYTEKKSRFIGELRPVSSQEEAAAFLRETRKLHNDARHHCMAWVIGERAETKHSSDDGEPSGTAGRPILSVLEGARLTNAALIVTRYFGGVLLGTGGLVRSYTAAAQAALASSVIICPRPAVTGVIRAGYDKWPLIQALFRKEQAFFLKVDYAADVTAMTVFYEEDRDRIIKALNALLKTDEPVSELSPCRLAEAGESLIIYRGQQTERFPLTSP